MTQFKEVQKVASMTTTRPWPKYPSIFEINAWVWLSELREKLGKRFDLGSVPAAEWDAIATFGFDAVWLMGVWERSPTGIAIANRNEGLLRSFRQALPDFEPTDNVGVWFFRPNDAFFPGASKRTQKPMGAVEGHAGYYIRPRLWASFDTNFWFAGRTAINGVEKDDARRESRLGMTLLIPFAAHQSLKFSYSRGAVSRVGGNFQTISTAWQYSWIDKQD